MQASQKVTAKWEVIGIQSVLVQYRLFYCCSGSCQIELGSVLTSTLSGSVNGGSNPAGGAPVTQDVETGT